MKHLLTLLLAAPLIFSLRFERLWDGTEVEAFKQSETEFQSEYLGSLAGKYAIGEGGLALVGRAGYKLQEEKPQYALGLEYTFEYGR